ncbi:MAG TPA: HBL/NHE enterotoxin family protein [Rubrobacter sp.]|nr:HBL/NHE enterotoxin family protein [Rubrobacter sp.]
MITAEAATSTNTNDKTASGFASLHIVTTSCHGVLNTQFRAPSPKPKWFDDLSGKLDAAKVLANQWIDDIAPQMTASIPSHVIDYGTTYSAITDEIVRLLEANRNATRTSNPQVFQQVSELIKALHESVDSIITEIQDTQGQLKDWGDAMQTSHDDLFNGAANIQSAQTELGTEIDKMNNAIKGLRELIDGENKAIAVGAGAIGIGLFALVVGIAFAPVTGGASLIVSGIGAAAIIGGAVDWGIMQSRINSQFSEIAKDQQKIDDDKRQLVALQGLSLAANSAINSVATATQALSDVKVLWTTFQNELKGTMNNLDKADTALSAIVSEAQVKAAKKEWDLAVDFAQQLSGVQLQVQAKELPMSA